MYPKSSGLSKGGQQVQRASACIKALIYHRVQKKERSPLIQCIHSNPQFIQCILFCLNSACKCPQNVAAKAKFVLAVEKFIVYSYIL